MIDTAIYRPDPDSTAVLHDSATAVPAPPVAVPAAPVRVAPPLTAHTGIPLLDSTITPCPAPEGLPQLAPLDSICEAYCQRPLRERPTLFSGHELPVQPAFPRNRYDQGPIADWVFLALLLLTGLVSLFVNQSRLKINDVARSAVNNRSLARLLRENTTKRFRMLIPMSLVFVSTLVLLVVGYASNGDILPYGLRSLAIFALALAITIAYYFLRNGLILLMGNIFESGPATRLYVTNTYIYDSLGALLLLPLTLVALYTPAPTEALLYVSLGAVGLLFLARLVRGLVLIFSAAKNSRFYLFYYLCILETVPPLILAKLFLL